MASYEEEKEKRKSEKDQAADEAGRYAGRKLAEKAAAEGARGAATSAAGTGAGAAGAAGGTAAGGAAAGGAAAGGAAAGGAAAGGAAGAAGGPVAPVTVPAGAVAGAAAGVLAKKGKYIILGLIGLIAAPIIAILLVGILVLVVFFALIAGAISVDKPPPDDPPIVGDGTGLLADYCIRFPIQGVPPPYPDAPDDKDKCSQEFRKLLETVANWAKMPAGVLAGVASIEGRHMFSYTDAEILDLVQAGKEDPYNNPSPNNNAIDNCNPSSAGALGPMQFMPGTWDGGGDKYHEAVNIATGEGRAEDICNNKDALYAAAWMLKCNSGGVPAAECSNGNFTNYDYDDSDDSWEGPPGDEGEADSSPGEAYKAAAAYYWGDPSMAVDCVNSDGYNYCASVWEYYQATKDSGTSGAPWGWPTSGTMSQGPYEANPSHGSWSAIDIAESTAQPIYATHDGNVIKYPDNGNGYGNYVEVFSSSYITRYAHLESFSPCLNALANNTLIKAGTYLGNTGWTGYVVPAGPGGRHLHYHILNHAGLNVPISEFNSLIPEPYTSGKWVNVDYSGSECILGP